MSTMNAYYAHESNVGPVFDVAHFSTFKTILMGVVGLLFAGAVGVAAVYVWNPEWLVAHPPEWFLDINQEIKDLIREHPLGVKIGVGVAALFAFLFAAAGLSCVGNALWGNYYFRVGENGMSLRLPGALFGTFERDLDWSQIEGYTVVQRKKFGALSRNDGNLGGELRLKTHDGGRYDLNLDCFREDAWLIYQRIQEAQSTQPAMLA